MALPPSPAWGAIPGDARARATPTSHMHPQFPCQVSRAGISVNRQYFWDGGASKPSERAPVPHVAHSTHRVEFPRTGRLYLIWAIPRAFHPFLQAVQHLAPPREGVSPGELSFEHGARTLSHLRRSRRVRGQANQALRQRFPISRFNHQAATMLPHEAGDLSLPCRHRDYRTPDSRDPGKFAWNDQTFELGS